MAEVHREFWPGWETVRLIGRGSFGAVYEIQRQVFDDTETAALKVISIPQNDSDIEEMYGDGYDDESITSTFQSHLQRIVAEYSLMRKLNGSANIVHCEDVRYVQHDDGIGWDIYIKMELLTPLIKALPERITDETVIKVAKDMCSALELCKKHEIVHRDIKPQNIFASSHGDYKLGDFGIAKTVERTMGGTKIGTYKYMAPEVYHNQPYGSGADIYSLGLVLYWMLNERRMPFLPMPPEKLKAGMEEEARNRRLSGEPLPPPAHGSKELKRIVLKACAYDLKDRYHSAAEMLYDLYRLTGETIGAAAVKGLGTTSKAVSEGISTSQPPEVNKGSNSSVKTDKTETPPKKEKPKTKNVVLTIVGIVAALAIIIFLLLRSCGTKPSTQIPTADPTTDSVVKPPEEQPPAATENSQGTPVQTEWSDWMDELPLGVTADDYTIEEKLLYSSRELETTYSTSQSTMDGWERFDTVEANGGFGAWSDWSENAVSATATREVETQTRYRYRDKETATSNYSTMDGWSLYDTTYSWSDYGAWSSWSTTPAYSSDSRNVATKTQYRFRSICYTTEYTDWSAWSSWSSNRQSTSDLQKEDTRTVWGYYYFQCPGCGAHMHGWDITCPKWAGGCGKTYIPRNSWVQVYSPTSWDNSGLKDWHGTGKYYTYIDGQLVFKWTDGGKQTQYRYATRSTYQVPIYDSWSGWDDTSYTSSEFLDVETRTVYRYCDRSQVATYHYYRWGNWSNWSENWMSATENRQVEETTYYRYRDQVTTKTYYFRRWTDWTEYSDSVVTPSDTVEVQTKTQYRYKSKEA